MNKPLDPKNPKLPEFQPYQPGTDPVDWLADATRALEQIAKQQDRWIDREVVAALQTADAIAANPELQRAWCKHEAWQQVSMKRPKEGKTASTREEVLRFVWSIRRGDQDGYELRRKAIEACPSHVKTPEKVVEWIRRNKGYVAVAKKKSASARREDLIEHDLTPKGPVQLPALSPRKSRGLDDVPPDNSPTVTFDVEFSDCYAQAKAAEDKVMSCAVLFDFKTDPPSLLLAIDSEA